MRVLVINFEMDDSSPVLAWQARIVRALAARCEQVVVLSVHTGAYTVPDNVHVEQFVWGHVGLRPTILLQAQQAWRLCKQYEIDVAFVHMASTFVYRLSPVFARFRIPTLLWYAHGSVTRRLRLAHRLVTRVVTSTPEGFRIPSQKVHVIGQGINTDLFALTPRSPEQRDLITVSRISRRKRIHLLLDALAHLRRDVDLHLKVIGPTLTDDDEVYIGELRAQVERLALDDAVTFVGALPVDQIPAYYQTAALHLNVSQTNSMDKTVMEALACGCPVLTSNPAFRETFAEYPDFIIQDAAPEAIAAQIRDLYARRAEFAPEALRALVVGRHDQASYVDKIMLHLRAIAE